MHLNNCLPLVDELDRSLNPEQVFRACASLPHVLFLDSALRDPVLGRYSFVTADPFSFLEVPVETDDGLTRIRQLMAGWKTETQTSLPPFQGGAAGLFAYDLCHSLEKVPAARHAEFEIPSLAIGLYDVVVAFDHQSNRSWIISQGFPATTTKDRLQQAQQRLDFFQQLLKNPPAQAYQSTHQLKDVPVHRLAPQFTVSGGLDLTSDFSATGYRQAVERAVEYIHAGDLFQVNLSQRLLCPAREQSQQLYLRLRQRNPATFAAYFDLGPFQIVSASPERFLQVRDRHVEARPIKGTRQRTRHAVADLFRAEELIHSEKDRAENVMIVDLLRNDLSRVCQPETVRVKQLCDLELYAFVQHLVSNVCGTLATGKTALDLVQASFPGGSITGAPKVRAMQIISEIEPTARGAYCGSLGYVGFDGAMDLSILIRTITAGQGWWQLPVGGGIVAQSSPQQEYEETWHKAQGLIDSLI
ncbi:MAG: anthranilate synthase component I family protein [Planctomycetota bacterium]|nr:anthranilate synthase component I family protein [Planctomycetota bacterium]